QPGAISQVFTNLITNSINHAFEHIEQGKITVDVSINKKTLEVEYSDNGKGMTEEQLKNVFEPFYTTKRGKGGSGLGGNIIYNIIVLKLKGTISVQSSLSQGTSFKISIPYMKEGATEDDSLVSN
ncbi:MAG: ATP-binding protein, partial [Gammaproteobacteria bacterium]|nr:ATP-binding protein [Gammaproteobacteria bacterium]